MLLVVKEVVKVCYLAYVYKGFWWCLTPFLLILFSIRQGDPLAMLLFILQIEPLLRRLQRDLAGLHVGRAKVAGLGYVDDVAAVGSNPDDIPALDSAVKDFEAVSGAILNRNRKSVIVGLGEWADRQEWPLPWLHVAPQAKVYGFVFAATVADTLHLSWDRVVSQGHFGPLVRPLPAHPPYTPLSPRDLCPVQIVVFCSAPPHPHPLPPPDPGRHWPLFVGWPARAPGSG
jgi:hypothetical protein